MNGNLDSMIRILETREKDDDEQVIFMSCSGHIDRV